MWPLAKMDFRTDGDAVVSNQIKGLNYTPPVDWSYETSCSAFCSQHRPLLLVLPIRVDDTRDSRELPTMSAVLPATKTNSVFKNIALQVEVSTADWQQQQ